MTYLIPIFSGLLFRAGGCDQWDWGVISVPGKQIPVAPNQKLWRWLMGLPIALIYCWGHFSLITVLLSTIAYFIATNVFGYGEKNKFTRWAGKYGQFAVSGFAFGMASYFLLGNIAFLQAIIGAISFVVIKILDDKNIVKNPFCELLRGLCGTILYSIR